MDVYIKGYKEDKVDTKSLSIVCFINNYSVKIENELKLFIVIRSLGKIFDNFCLFFIHLIS